MMILEMEMASSDAIRGKLQPGWVTVGTEVNVRHLAAALVGATVRTTASVIAVERRVIRFEVAAFEGERKLGEGQHARGLIDVAKFNQRLGANKGLVMRGLDPRIHHVFTRMMDCRVKPGNDGFAVTSPARSSASSPQQSRGSSAAAGHPLPSAPPARPALCRRAR